MIYEGQPQLATIDFGKYGIDLVGDGDGLWVPLPTLEALFVDIYQFHVYYNGTGIYVWDGGGLIQVSNARPPEGSTADYYAFAAEGETKSAARAAFDYSNLCFMVDTFYGAPSSRCRIATEIMAKGLDAALDTDDVHKEIKALLKSTDMRDYIKGLHALFSLALDDGSHTGFADTEWDSDSGAIMQGWSEGWMSKGMSGTTDLPRLTVTLSGLFRTLYMTLSDPSNYDHLEIWEGSGTLRDFQCLYFDKGDTAVFVIGTLFSADDDGWKAYYDSGGNAQLPLDTYGMFLRALDAAKANPNVKNFVVDMSMSMGGNSNVAIAMAKAITGAGYRYEYNTVSGRNERILYDVDLNLDGSFDEKDEAVTLPFRFAVLESTVSYSSSNFFPSVMRDAGVMVLGEKSGGGSCAPQKTPESEGLFFMMSSRLKLIDNAGNEIDDGIEPDAVLVDTVDGVKDYSRYYDVAGLSSLINEFYLEPGPSLAKASISNVAVNVLGGSCKVAWNKVADATSYEVAYRKAGTSSWTLKAAKGTSCTLTPLPKGKAYQVRVRAKSAQTDTTLASVGAWSPVRRVYVEQVSDLKAASGKKGSKSIVVTWKKTKGSTGYKVSYSAKKSMAGAKTVTVKGSEKVKRVLKGLKQRTVYYVKTTPYKSIDGKVYLGQQSAAKKARAA